MAFPQTPLSLTTEILINGVWTDYSSSVRSGMDQEGLHITRSAPIGRGIRPSPALMTGVFNNRSLTFSYLTPGTTNFRKINRNTQIRQKIGSDVRFWGELGELQFTADEANRDLQARFQAAGISRRLSTDKKKLKSPAYRALISSDNDATRLAWWPLEDGPEATSPTSPVGSPSIVSTFLSTAPSFGAYTNSISSERMVTMGSGHLDATVPAYTSTQHKVIALYYLPWDSSYDNTTLMRLNCTSCVMFVRWFDGGGLDLQVYNNSGTALLDSTGTISFDAVNKEFLLVLELTQSGANVNVTIRVIEAAAGGSASSTSDTLVGITIGRIEEVQLTAPQGSVGQLAVGNSVNAFTNYIDVGASGGRGVQGYAGETAVARITRLCTEEGVTLTVGGNSADSAQVGPQQVDTFYELLWDAAETDMGILFDTRDALGLTYRTRTSLYNQTDAELDYDTNELGKPQLSPLGNDENLRNSVVAERIDGSSAKYSIPDGDFWHLTTEDPEDNTSNGVGLYEVPLPLNAYTDSQLEHMAEWWAHLGSWNELRHSKITVDMSRSQIAGDTALTAKIKTVDLGDHVLVTDPPSWLPPDDIEGLVQGYIETLAQYRWEISWDTTHARPYEVWQLDTGGSTLAVAVNSSATSLKLATSSGPEWSTTHEPYHIQIAGEAMTVTAMTTDTSAFVASGTVAHGVNASVTPSLPAGITADVGQALICFAAIRNSGTGTVDLPAGWTNLVNFGNIRVFGKYYVTGDVAPVVSFTGGVANADTSAQMMGLSGTSLELDDGKYGATNISPRTQLNGSVQDIAFPALSIRRDGGRVIVVGWKQDDWTSVATVTGFSETGEPDTTTGDDQGIVWDRAVQTTATDITADSFVVTGGAVAISRSAIFSLRPLQTATVTRSVNGVTGSITAGQAVHGWRLGVNAL